MFSRLREKPLSVLVGLAVGVSGLACSSGSGGGPAAPVPANAAPRIEIAIPAEAEVVRPAGQTLVFEVQASDPEGAPLSFEIFLDGQRVGAANHFEFVPAAPGSHQVEIRVSDGSNVAVYRWTVSVTPRVPQAPLATLAVTPDSGSAPLTVAIQAAGSDPDGRVARVQVDADGDGVFEVDQPGPVTVGQTFAAAGVYVVRALVTDDEGLTGSAERAVRVAPNLPPQVEMTVTPAEGYAPLLVRVRGAGTDPDGVVTRHELDGDGDGRFEISQPGPIDTTLVVTDYTRPVTMTLLVSDDRGQTVRAMATVRARPPVDAGRSQLTQNDTGRLLADGRAARRLSLQVVDQQGQPLPGVEVELASSRNAGSAGIVDQITPVRGVTDAAGRFEAELRTTSSSTLLGDATVSALADGRALAGTVTVQFFSAVDATNTSVTCLETTVHVASSPFEPRRAGVQALVHDLEGRPFPDVHVEFRTRDRQDFPVSPPTGRTDAGGVFSSFVSSERANDNTYVDVYADGLRVADYCLVSFIP